LQVQACFLLLVVVVAISIAIDVAILQKM